MWKGQMPDGVKNKTKNTMQLYASLWTIYKLAQKYRPAEFNLDKNAFVKLLASDQLNHELKLKLENILDKVNSI